MGEHGALMTTEANASPALVLLRISLGGVSYSMTYSMRYSVRYSLKHSESCGVVLISGGSRGMGFCLEKGLAVYSCGYYPSNVAGCWCQTEIRGVSSHMHHCMIPATNSRSAFQPS